MASFIADDSLSERFSGPADFETAIESCGFGFFNIILLFTGILVTTATNFESGSTSYILSSAECDLDLNLMDKGYLNAMSYAGMITSGIIWGYLGDKKGRKITLMQGLFLNVLCLIGAACSRNFLSLLIFKFLGGLTICGSYALSMSYIGELHGKTHRARAFVILNVGFPATNIILPSLAMSILPQDIDVVFLGLEFHAWQIFLAICMLPSLSAAIILYFMPESPKFFMSLGRNEEALQVFARIYAMNKHVSRDEYPVKKLENELKSTENHPTPEKTEAGNSNERTKSCSEGFLQLNLLIQKPIYRPFILFLVASFFGIAGVVTFRLWVPSIYSAINEYESVPQFIGTQASVCDVLNFSVNKSQNIEMELDVNGIDVCEVVLTVQSYTSNIIEGLIGLPIYALTSCIVTQIGMKKLLVLSCIISGTSGLFLSLSQSIWMTIILAAFSSAFGGIVISLLLGAGVFIFPTSQRSMVMSISTMVGRIGIVACSILFPLFMEMGCMYPLLMLGVALYVSGLVSFFLPIDCHTPLK